jgi:hypothetical protein
MLDAQALRNAQNGEEWVVQKKRNKHEANGGPAARFA